MGMFDNLVCELDIPGLGLDVVCQTKDTPEPLSLSRYTIDPGGRLLLNHWDFEPDPDSQGSRWGPYMRKVEGSERMVDQNFDGDIIFYPCSDSKFWVDYRATFRQGSCVEICRNSQDPTEDHNHTWVRVWTPKETT